MENGVLLPLKKEINLKNIFLLFFIHSKDLMEGYNNCIMWKRTEKKGRLTQG